MKPASPKSYGSICSKQIHGGTLESARQTHLVSSVLTGVWNVLKNQQLHGWDLDPKTIAPSMNKWECFFLIMAPDNDAYCLDLFED